ncbi:uncharacterized protein LOC131007701 isoform X2 [Salvia miltiorrhiza]|uniref:uncharacterized protein LOC131007701 isoform X2 n=1 Tax=Salvia miltiorrhiza TaxID=226208 RepID=UPI0025AD42CE|nr:uncharacterized protein LOC131007701 isoform X2 [Salvia miltiorrhiza]
MDPKKLKAPDSPMEKLRSPAKKRTKAMHPRVSVSDKGKSKTSMVATFSGSSSVGAKRNLNKDMFQFVPRNPSINLVDLTNSNERSCSTDVIKPPVMKVNSRRNNKGPKFNTRTTPAAFHDSLRKLNEAQKNAVREIGFGRILDLKLKDLPRHLAYWILNKFNS